MKEFKSKFFEKINRANNVNSFRFEPAEKIDFIPGQFLQIVFDEENRDNKDLNKYLSFSSAPGKDYFEVTKKLSESEFSKKLESMKAGDEILIKAPMGNCVYKDEYKKIGFLAGGIGITPGISIIEYIAEKRIDTDVCLLYSNWTENDIAFERELDGWSKEHENIKIIHTLVENKNQNSKYLTGTINKDFALKNMPDYKERILFIFGPPGMVKAMNEICSELKCNKEMIKSENFMGY